MIIPQEARDMLLQNISHRKIAKIFGVGLGTVSRWRNKLGLGKKQKTKESVYVDEITTRKEEGGLHEIRHEGAEIITKEQFLKHIQFDENSFEIVSYQCNLRPVVIRVSSNETLLVKKYEHFLRTKPIKGFDVDKYIDNLQRKIEKIKYQSQQGKIVSGEQKMLEICLFDVHINKRSYASQERNCEIAKEIYLSMIDRMIEKATKLYKYDFCLFVIGQDFFNSDFNSNTTRGTPQDNTETEEEAFAIGIEILISAIEKLYKSLSCQIKVVNLPGNHAKNLENILGISLKHIFRNNNDIIIDTESKSRKYYQYGNTAIMFSHGDGCRQDRIPMLFANEAPELRGSSKYRQVHLGHIHSKTQTEVNGVIIKHLSSMTTTDKRHHEQGYVGNRRGGQMFIFDKQYGEECCFDFFLN